jgi:hypothetical protein
MSSFYGNGISKEVMDKEIQEANNHIIFSKTEPTVQKAGDIWVVIGEFADKNTTSTEGENNG